MIIFKAIKNSVPPQRIISLVPSITELLFYLGLEENIVGITKFCVHPREFVLTKTKIGGTKNININKIRSLKPDLIIANKEENVEKQINSLAKDFPIFLTDVNDLSSALIMIKNTGQITHKIKEATNLIDDINKKLSLLTLAPSKLNAAYLIWKDPYMSIGGDTYINEMLCHCGFKNIFATQKRYPVVTIDELKSKNCKLLLLSTEPYPFKQKHIDELKIELPDTTIILVDGEMFSWYGSRLLLAADYFQCLIQKVNAVQ